VPWFWIVAGPNGAGKSTLVQSQAIAQLFGDTFVRLNADELTKQILAGNPGYPGANLQAAIETDAAVAQCIENGVDFMVETVLSSEKYLDDVEKAVERGYHIGIIYVGLATPADAVRRVALRHTQGGHDVPTDRIISRWSRSVAMLGRFLPHADRAYIFDNTEPATHTGPTLIAIIDEGHLTLLSPGRIPELDAVMNAALGRDGG
jgi:predicted ABC-type ATPase